MASRRLLGLVARTLAFGACAACGSRTGLFALGAADGAAPEPEAASETSTPCGTPETTVLASGQSEPQAIALDDTFVYFTTQTIEPSTGAIVKVPKCGGDPVTLATGLATSWSIAVDDARVYWGVVPTGDIGDGFVVSVPKDGGVVATLASGVYDPLYVAVDATDVYWSSSVAETISRVPKGGGAVTTLASGQAVPQQIALDDASVVWLNGEADGGSGVMILPKAGGTPARLGTARFGSGLALDGTGAIWASEDPSGATDSLLRVPLTGGAPAPLAHVTTYVVAMATDGHDLYFTDSSEMAGGSFVGKVATHGGSPSTVAFGQSDPLGIAVDGAYVYWVDGTGKVLRRGK
jgi:hypothetical protein